MNVAKPTSTPSGGPRPTVVPPPNAPADVEWDAGGGKLSLTYHGTVILDAVVAARGSDGEETRAGVVMQPTMTTGEKIEQGHSEGLVAPRRIARDGVLVDGRSFPPIILLSALGPSLALLYEGDIMKTLEKQMRETLIACSMLLALPLSARAGEPNAADLDKAIKAGDFTEYFANVSAWLNQDPAEGVPRASGARDTPHRLALVVAAGRGTTYAVPSA